MLTNHKWVNAQEPLTKPFTGDRMILPMVGATPVDINQMLDAQDEGEPVPGVPDRNMLERSFDECYLVSYDEHDHGFEDYVGVAWQ